VLTWDWAGLFLRGTPLRRLVNFAHLKHYAKVDVGHAIENPEWTVMGAWSEAILSMQKP